MRSPAAGTGSPAAALTSGIHHPKWFIAPPAEAYAPATGTAVCRSTFAARLADRRTVRGTRSPDAYLANAATPPSTTRTAPGGPMNYPALVTSSRHVGQDADWQTMLASNSFND